MSRKFLVIGAPRASDQQADQAAAMGRLMVAEIEAVWRDYARGLIREIYQRADQPGVVIMCEADTRAEVEQMVDALPLAKGGFIATEVIELAPFTLWSTLFAHPAAKSGGSS